jgi:predicted ribosomally synthesized peptide with nif11-like leader
MSKENLEQFMNQIAESEELQAKIGEEIDAESLIALGAENGCEFTEEDIQESAELSDEELDGVAGGFETGPISGSNSQAARVESVGGGREHDTIIKTEKDSFRIDYSRLRVRSNRIIDPQY